MNENNSINSGINSNLCGFYKVQSVDSRTGEVVLDYGWNKNLILNSGMDLVALNYYSTLTNYCIAGTGSRMNFITGGLSIITQSGNFINLLPAPTGLQNFSSSITSSTNVLYYSSSLQVGDVIVYTNNSQSNVTAIDMNAGLTASVDTSYTIPSASLQKFIIWKTSQTGLHLEKKRTATYLVGVGNCGYTDSTGSNSKPNVRTFRRTYDFPSEAATILYTEIGTSPVVTANTSVFSRILLPIPITISSSFQLRVIYDLQVTYTPDIPRYITASISGWPVGPSTNTYATESIQAFLASAINTSGVGDAGGGVLEPFATSDPPGTGYTKMFVCSNTGSLSDFNTTIDRSLVASSASTSDTNVVLSYITKSYTLYKVDTFGLNIANQTNIRSMGLGLTSFTDSPAQIGRYALGVLFNQSQSKANTQTLSFTWKFSWSRTLS